ncbi:hypothetical protein F2Q70_00015258 [Brassica cretica]|uniref:Uncharacterized protein n=1 Tax=Brassica cretica TaxID=69181 RepID=A0A8S9I2J6_BRACR|nr:hypothetical protein F2Q70_00015258 [Brassica cretica]
MRLKKNSTSTDVEHAHDLSNSTKGEKKRKKSTVHNANKDTEHSHKVKNVRASKKIAANHVAIDRLTSTIEDAYDVNKILQPRLYSS